jgi:hypothetical protein
LLPKIGGGAMQHGALDGLCPTVPLIVQSALDGRVEGSGRKVGLNASVDRRRTVLVKPPVQLLYFARSERSDGKFNFLDGIYARETLILTRAVGKSPVRGNTKSSSVKQNSPAI